MTKKKKVLIVEDEEQIRKIIRTDLERRGITVSEAADGELALQMVFDERPDALVLDILMPKMHGMEFLARLREDTWGQHLPVIILTNIADDPKVVEVSKKYSYTLLKKAETKLGDIVSSIIAAIG